MDVKEWVKGKLNKKEDGYYIDDEWDENEKFPKRFGKLTYKI